MAGSDIIPTADEVRLIRRLQVHHLSAFLTTLDEDGWRMAAEYLRGCAALHEYAGAIQREEINMPDQAGVAQLEAVRAAAWRYVQLVRGPDGAPVRTVGMVTAALDDLAATLDEQPQDGSAGK